MKHIKLFEQFINRVKLNEEKFFDYDNPKTKITDPNAYTEQQLTRAADYEIDGYSYERASNKIKAKYNKKENSIVCKYKNILITYYYNEDIGCWIAAFEERFNAENAIMSLDEFVSEIQNWFYNYNRS